MLQIFLFNQLFGGRFPGDSEQWGSLARSKAGFQEKTAFLITPSESDYDSPPLRA